jgi:hypothetical protein
VRPHQATPPHVPPYYTFTGNYGVQPSGWPHHGPLQPYALQVPVPYSARPSPFWAPPGHPGMYQGPTASPFVGSPNHYGIPQAHQSPYVPAYPQLHHDFSSIHTPYGFTPTYPPQNAIPQAHPPYGIAAGRGHPICHLASSPPTVRVQRAVESPTGLLSDTDREESDESDGDGVGDLHQAIKQETDFDGQRPSNSTKSLRLRRSTRRNSGKAANMSLSRPEFGTPSPKTVAKLLDDDSDADPTFRITSRSPSTHMPSSLSAKPTSPVKQANRSSSVEFIAAKTIKRGRQPSERFDEDLPEPAGQASVDAGQVQPTRITTKRRRDGATTTLDASAQPCSPGTGRAPNTRMPSQGATSTFAHKPTQVPQSCLSQAFHNNRFRREVTKDTYVILRQAYPPLKPWAWQQTILSANPAYYDIHGDGSRDCFFYQRKPLRIVEDDGDVVDHYRVTIKWACDSSRHDQHKIEVTLKFRTLLGSGLMTKEHWLSYLTGEHLIRRGIVIAFR